MSAVIANPAAGGAPPAKRGTKKLLMIVAAILVLALLGAGGAVYYLKKRAHAAAEAAAADGDGPGADVAAAADKHESLNPPTYLPLDPFVVNLADRESDRYLQIGITLEVSSPAFAEQMKAYMPAVRSAILMVITRKTSRELLDPQGKELLADQIAREAVRPMGIDIAAPEPMPAASSAQGGASGAASAQGGASGAASAAGVERIVALDAGPPARARRKPEVKNPVQHVNFSSFIIQ